MRVLAIDPGSEKSGYVVLENGVPTEWGHWENMRLLFSLPDYNASDLLAIEYVYLRGMKIYQQAVDTVFWVGRFAQAFPGPFRLIDRKDEKMVLCGNTTANDTSIRIALIDRFGGRDVAIGGKKCQRCKGKGWVGRGRPRCPDCSGYTKSRIVRVGPRSTEELPLPLGTGLETPKGVLHGMKGTHTFAALAVGCTWIDQQANGETR